jgi:hypothetical protein
VSELAARAGRAYGATVARVRVSWVWVRVGRGLEAVPALETRKEEELHRVQVAHLWREERQMGVNMGECFGPFVHRDE